MTVHPWGIGKPDFVEITSPTRTEVQAESQTPWNITLYRTTVPANTTLTFSALYTVPANKILVIGYIKASLNIDCIAEAILLKDGVAYCPLFHPQLTAVTYPDTAGLIYNAGEALGFSGINPLPVPLLLNGDISGFLYDV